MAEFAGMLSGVAHATPASMKHSGSSACVVACSVRGRVRVRGRVKVSGRDRDGVIGLGVWVWVWVWVCSVSVIWHLLPLIYTYCH